MTWYFWPPTIVFGVIAFAAVANLWGYMTECGRQAALDRKLEQMKDPNGR